MGGGWGHFPMLLHAGLCLVAWHWGRGYSPEGEMALASAQLSKGRKLPGAGWQAYLRWAKLLPAVGCRSCWHQQDQAEEWVGPTSTSSHSLSTEA